MHIQRPHLDVSRHVISKNSNSPEPTPPTPPGEHHQHGVSGTLLHVGHDVAMVGMSLPSPAGPEVICGGTDPNPHSAHQVHDHHEHHAPDAHAGHQHGTGSNWVGTGTAVLSGAVAIGAAVHGVQMLSSKDRFTQMEGANHLLMSASCGVMAGAMLAPSSGLAPFSSPLMAAHGIGEAALGVYQVSKGVQDDCQGHTMAGALKIAHGGCLAAAQFFPGAALPLYLGMAAATASQLALQQAGLSH